MEPEFDSTKSIPHPRIRGSNLSPREINCLTILDIPYTKLCGSRSWFPPRGTPSQTFLSTPFLAPHHSSPWPSLVQPVDVVCSTSTLHPRHRLSQHIYNLTFHKSDKVYSNPPQCSHVKGCSPRILFDLRLFLVVYNMLPSLRLSARMGWSPFSKKNRPFWSCLP